MRTFQNGPEESFKPKYVSDNEVKRLREVDEGTVKLFIIIKTAIYEAV